MVGAQTREPLRELGDEPARARRRPGRAAWRAGRRARGRRRARALRRTVGTERRARRRSGRAARSRRRDRPRGPSSAARRVLPTPGSPATSTARRAPAAASFHAIVTCSYSSSRPASEKRGAIENARGSGSCIVRTASGAHSTSHAASGSGSPFSSSSPTGRSVTSARLPSSTRTTSATSTWPDARRRAQPRRLDHGRAEPVVVLERRLTDRDADAERERQLARAGEHVDLLLHAACGAHGVGVARERHHQPVAEVLHLGPAVGGDLGPQRVEHVVAQRRRPPRRRGRTRARSTPTRSQNSNVTVAVSGSPRRESLRAIRFRRSAEASRDGRAGSLGSGVDAASIVCGAVPAQPVTVIVACIEA